MSKKKVTKQQYYTPTTINRRNATYNVIFGERSNGKTYALLRQSIEQYVKTGKQMAYVRRWKDDIVGRRAQQLFTGLAENGEIEKITKGEFTGVHYWAGKWYLCTYNDDGRAIYHDQDIVAFSFALSDSEHDKSTSFPRIGTVVFDEFLTNRSYIPDEFVLFMNVISTIVRRRTDVKIYMLGNTVNKFCPYFQEMGLTNIAHMRQGTIDLYQYGNSELTVAVEYCASTQTTGESNKYFAFDNPKLNMITSGAWELALYPHLPMKYKPKHVLLTYYIDFNGQLYQAEVIEKDGTYFTFIHVKTTPIKDPQNSLIYTLENKPQLNYNMNILKPINKVQERVLWFFKTERVYYQNNEVGDAIANYIRVCRG